MSQGYVKTGGLAVVSRELRRRQRGKRTLFFGFFGWTIQSSGSSWGRGRFT